MLPQKKAAILKKWNVPRTKLNWDILTTAYHYAVEHDFPLDKIPVLKTINTRLGLTRTDLRFLEEDAGPHIPSDQLPFKMQEGLGQKNIKDYAAFYTGSEAGTAMAIAIENMIGKDVVLCDPFCGAGTLLSTITGYLGDKIRLVYGFELFPFSAMVAYIATGCKLDLEDIYKLKIITGDSFAIVRNNFYGGGLWGKMLVKPNAIVTNPPYLSWNKVGNKGRIRAEMTLSKGNYDLSNTNYTAYGTFLGDLILENDGFYGIILPISSFYNKKTKEAIDMFFKRYDVRAVLTRNDFKNPYSLACQLTDVVMVSRKTSSNGKYYTGMVTDEKMYDLMKNLKKMPKVKGIKSVGINENSRLGLENPSAYIMEPELTEVMEKVLKVCGNKLSKIRDVFGDDVVKHQVSLPSPIDFYFVPNKTWSVKEFIHVGDFKTMVLDNGAIEIEIPHDHYIPVIFRPRYSRNNWKAKPSHYGLLFQDTLTKDERKYVKSWNIHKKGNWWTEYRKNVERLEWARVHLFRVLNFAMKNHAGVAIYTKEKMPPVSSFLRIVTPNQLTDTLAFNWFNSLPFFCFLKAFGRKFHVDAIYMIGGTYLDLPFPNVNLMESVDVDYIVSKDEAFKKQEYFWNSIPRPHDDAWCEWLGINDDLKNEMIDVLKQSYAEWDAKIV